MNKTKTKIAEADQDQSPNDVNDTNNETGSANQCPFSSFTTKLRGIESKVKNCNEQLCLITRRTQELQTTEHVIAELSTQNRELREQFHEREVLLPLFSCIISILDRCRQQTDRFVQLKDKYIKNKNRAAASAVRSLIYSKKADIVELENVLANYGIESFRNHKDTFDPRVQKCIERTPCYEKELHGSIAQRLLPGYKRYEKILRQEFVTVFTLSEIN